MKRGNRDWTFITTKLSDDERATFEDYAIEYGNSVLQQVISLLHQGYKLTARLDVERDVWIVALSGTDYSAFNQRCSLTSRHHELELALLLTCFKNDILSQKNEWRDDSSQAVWG